MYTDDQYKRAKAQFGGAPPEAQSILKTRISEYERYNPGHGATEEGAHAASGELLSGDPQSAAAEPKLSHEEPETKQLNKEAFDLSAPFVPEIEDQTTDLSLPNASKLKTLATPPEYVAKNPLNGLAHVAKATLGDPIDGPLASSYFEPSERQFQQAQGAALKARGILPGTEAYTEQFNEYKDRKWAQAYQAAEAEDRPLTRREYVQHSTGWGKVEDFLANTVDAGGAFVKGLAAGRSLHLSTALGGVSDALTGRDDAGNDAAQAERNPLSSLAGELKGSIAQSGPLAQITEAAGGPLGSGAAGRVAGAAVGGAVAGELDNAQRSLAQASTDSAHGEGYGSARDNFVSHLLGSGLVGGAFGAGGQLIAEGGTALQRKVLSDAPELADLRAGGGDTDILRGIKPGPAVAENIEAARPPLPGENKPYLRQTPTEVAVSKVREPLAAGNAKMHDDTYERLAAEKEAAYASNPELLRPVSTKNSSDAAVQWVLSKLQPELKANWLPGASIGPRDAIPGAETAEAEKLVKRLWKPRLVTSVEAADAARSGGGKVISAEDAQKLGINIGDLGHQPAPATGVPHDAPAIDDSAFASAASKAAEVAHSTGTTPDVGKFLNQTRRASSAAEQAGEQVGETASVDRFLAAARAEGATYDGAVYRGMSQPELDALLKDGQNAHTWSVSKDRDGAMAFAKKTGILVHVEGGAGAVPVDGLAGSNTFGEAWVPKGQRFEVVSDSTENGLRVVTVKPTDEASAGSTTEDVFGRKADPVTSTPRELGPRAGRAKPGPAPTPGSDWEEPDWQRSKFDLIYHEHATPDPFPAGTPKAGQSEVTRVSNSPPIPHPPEFYSRGRPDSPPPELMAKPTPAAAQAQEAGLPPEHFKVVLEPREYDAKTFEEILGDIDRKAGYAKKTGAPDPQWERLAQAIRKDREQFGPEWTDMIGRHHDELNDIEQRSYHAGMGDDKLYGEMHGSAQERLQNRLEGFPGKEQSTRALIEIADLAEPGVRRDLEVLGAQNAYGKLKGQANPRMAETLGAGGVAGHLRGLGPAVKFRADAMARGLSKGPTGQDSVITPRLLKFIESNGPKGSRWLPGVPTMGGGALGLKAGVTYNELTEDQRDWLDSLTSAIGLKKTGATP